MPITPTFDPIHSVVLDANASSISIPSINQNYNHLCITGGFTRSLSGDFGARSADFRWNGISSGYRSQTLIASNNSGASGSRVTNGVAVPTLTAGNINDQGGRNAFEIWIPNYNTSTFWKHILVKQNAQDTAANNGGTMFFMDSLVPTNAALTSLVISQVTDTFVAGDWVTIYGVKNA